MKLIDTHCHLTFEPLADDVPGVVDRSRAAGVSGWITVGTSVEDSRRAVALAERYEGMYATVGVHPHDARLVDDAMLAELEVVGRAGKVVAIGETGLDYHYNFSAPEEQKRVFAAHLALAAALDLPVVIHCREAFDDTIAILDRVAALKGVVFHCFGGTAEQAKLVLERGYFISFTGVVTFKNAHKTREVAKVVPLDRLMVETDCPYMSPEPVRRQKPNEPALMAHTAGFLAALKGRNPEDFARETTKTAGTFFSLEPSA
ncbi:MAG: TatD family hydrolase [Sedimentisphaerales bacterium]|nr:TatD family hydrolase [Sedimentisphaerales bacterium]